METIHVLYRRRPPSKFRDELRTSSISSRKRRSWEKLLRAKRP